MNNEEGDWRDDALELYALVSTELDPWVGSSSKNVKIILVDMHEVLLDLNDAIIANDPERARTHIAEMLVLLAELRLGG